MDLAGRVALVTGAGVLALLSSLLVPAPDGLLQPRPVGTEVNSVRNNGPGLTTPVVLNTRLRPPAGEGDGPQWNGCDD